VNSSCHFKNIDPDALDLGDTTFNLRPFGPEHPSAELTESIRQFGFLHPPLVQQQSQNRYKILSGRKRIQAAIDMPASKNKKLLCLVVPRHAPVLLVYSLLLHHALIGGQLSIIEQANFFKKALQAAPEDEILPLLKPLGYKQYKHKVRELLDFLSLDKSVIACLHKGQIHPKNARKMLGLQPGDQQEIIRLISQFHMGGSKQQQLIHFSIELIMRRNQSLKEILKHRHDAQHTKIRENPPQETTHLLNWLHDQCFPSLEIAENEFKQWVAELNLPPDISVSHTPYFEDNGVTASLSFDDFNALKNVLPEIKKLITIGSKGD